MHTDEYEISITRERNHCQQVVKKTQAKLAERRQTYGMDYHEAVLACAEGRLALSEKELAQWHDDVEALPQWEQRLEEYREALAMMRISASHF